jgi:hypothetical protein
MYTNSLESCNAVSTNASGTYTRREVEEPPFDSEVFRLDVDGAFPLAVASGTGTFGLKKRLDWFARPLTEQVTPHGTVWTGPIIYRSGEKNMIPHTTVSARRKGTALHVVFSGPGMTDRAVEFAFQGSSFRSVEFEFDYEEGVTPLTEIDPHAHSDRPAGLPAQIISINSVFEQAGFSVTATGQNAAIPLASAGVDKVWTNAEMHDAMQNAFSRFVNRPQWSLWTFFAGLHEDGVGLGGIMFDDIGPNHRQGTALFLNSFIANPPVNDLAPDAWVRRMTFWTAVHEMGHAFNLTHSWDKDFDPWIPQRAGYDLLSFMNYPYYYPTGQFSDKNTARFFRDFHFRFTDDELLFLRHAPEDFVQMGNADWAHGHAFEQADELPIKNLALTLRVNRSQPKFEFMEPVVIELKLTNVSGQPLLIEECILESDDRMIIIVYRQGGETRQFAPYAHYCRKSPLKVLSVDDSAYGSLFLSANKEGWLIDQPGNYTVTVCLRLKDEDVLSNSLSIRVLPPLNREEEVVAQDYFSDDVGRVLTFDGSHVLETANDVLRELVDRDPQRNAAIHAQVALASPRIRPFKMLLPRRAAENKLDVSGADTEATKKFIELIAGNQDTSDKVAAALGHVDYRHYALQLVQALKKTDHADLAAQCGLGAARTLEKRGALSRVVHNIIEHSKEGEAK